MTRFSCKTCGAESPAGIGYVVHHDDPLPEPSPDCGGYHAGGGADVPRGVHWNGHPGFAIELVDDPQSAEEAKAVAAMRDDMDAALLVARKCGLPFVVFIDGLGGAWQVTAFATQDEADECVEHVPEGSFAFDARTHRPAEAGPGRVGYSHAEVAR